MSSRLVLFRSVHSNGLLCWHLQLSLSGQTSSSSCLTCLIGSFCEGGAHIAECPEPTYSETAGLSTESQCLPCPSNAECFGGANVHYYFSLQLGLTPTIIITVISAMTFVCVPFVFFKDDKLSNSIITMEVALSLL